MSQLTVRNPSDDDLPSSRALRHGRFSISGQVYHVTSRAHGDTRPFADFRVACVICSSFGETAKRSGVRILAWVLMPDHAHWLIELGENANLSKSVAALKRRSASAANAVAGIKRASIWQDGFHDRALRRDEDLLTVTRYIVANPLRAGLVSRLGDYPFWDSVWL